MLPNANKPKKNSFTVSRSFLRLNAWRRLAVGVSMQTQIWFIGQMNSIESLAWKKKCLVIHMMHLRVLFIGTTGYGWLKRMPLHLKGDYRLISNTVLLLQGGN